MRDRAMGIENEFGVMLRYDKTKYRSLTNAEVISMKEEDFPESVFSNSRFWLYNGGCIYKDIGGHPEYATPECRSAADLVAYTKAGEILVPRMLDYTWADGSKLELFKNNLGIGSQHNMGAAFGCHENYLSYFFNPGNFALQKHLLPFLVSRQILDGAGWWRLNGDFLISQRALKMKADVGGGTTEGGGRGIINTRDEAHSRIKRLKRLHLILGDANMLEFPLFIKAGTTSIIMAMLEDGYSVDLRCINPVQALKDIARDLTGREKVIRLDSLDELSALEVQNLYVEKARKYLSSTTFESEATEAEAFLVLKYWEDALNAIYSQDIDWMLGRIDYVTKRWLAEREIKKKDPASEEEELRLKKKIDLFYHRITDRRFVSKIEEIWADKRIVTDAQIQKALDNPPQNTRARLRGEFCRVINSDMENLESQFRYSFQPAIDWKDLRYKGRTFQIDNPLVFEDDGFLEFIDDLS